MLYNFYFDLCAVCILTTVGITSLSRRRVPAYRQRAYSMLFFVVTVATLAERIETVLQMNHRDVFCLHFQFKLYFC